MVDGQRHVTEIRLANRLAVVVGLHGSEEWQILFHLVSHAIEDARALGYGSAAPFVGSRVRCIDRPLDIFGLGSRDLADHLAGR
jgi:hypothetical protein